MYITLYKKVNFEETQIERQFTNNLGHQQIMIDKLTVNNLSLGIPLIITKFINDEWTKRPQYSCPNPLKADYKGEQKLCPNIKTL